MSTFTIKDRFYLNGEPFQIISGAIHYFRVPPEYWRDRLEKLKAMGCNTVETYVPWNLHEPQRGQYDFSGGLNVSAFLRTAQELGLYAIVRPSPYICAEWDFGGLPAWLLAGEDIPLRSAKGPFLEYVAEYYKELFPKLVPHQLDRGGNVILFQVENEYAAFPDSDPDYLPALAKLMRENGAVMPFITSDNLLDGDVYPVKGMVPGALPTLNAGSGLAEKLNLLSVRTGGGPLMVTEFWVGWYDDWGEPHHTATPEQNAADLDAALARGSVNFYMFHGGTNFGFLNGANFIDHYMPLVTSYDYDAPLTEDGQTTAKYAAFRAVIGKYRDIPPVKFSTLIERRAYGAAEPDGRCALFATVGPQGITRKTPESMERLGQNFGYTLYRKTLPAGTRLDTLQLTNAADRVQVFLDGKPVLTLYGKELNSPHEINITLKEETTLDLFAENLGRVNYGAKLYGQRKGLDGPVLLNGEPLNNWQCFPYPLEPETVAAFPYTDDAPEGGPTFCRFRFHVDEPGDTFLALPGWGKGCAFVNGVNIGRYWDIGPQRRLYVPGPLLKKGENRLILFETEGRTGDAPRFEDAPDLG